MRIKHPVTMTIDGVDLARLLTEKICDGLCSFFEGMEVIFVSEQHGTFRLDLVSKASQPVPLQKADKPTSRGVGKPQLGTVLP